MSTASANSPHGTRGVPASLPALPSSYWADPSVYRFSVEQYQRMAEQGILKSDDKVELLEGIVVQKMPRNPPQDGTIQVLTKRLGRRVPIGWDLRIQLTVVLSDSQPEPDASIARGDESTYLSRHPKANDIGLIIEVADSSLLRDQRDKARIYARSGIVLYWIINLVDRRVEVHSLPSGPTGSPGYGSIQNYAPGEIIPLPLDGLSIEIPVNDLLP